MLANPSFLFGMNSVRRSMTRSVASKYPKPKPIAHRQRRTSISIDSNYRCKRQLSLVCQSFGDLSRHYKTAPRKILDDRDVNATIIFVIKVLEVWETSESCKTTTRERTRSSSMALPSTIETNSGSLPLVHLTLVIHSMSRPRQTTGLTPTGKSLGYKYFTSCSKILRLKFMEQIVNCD